MRFFTAALSSLLIVALGTSPALVAAQTSNLGTTSPPFATSTLFSAPINTSNTSNNSNNSSSGGNNSSSLIIGGVALAGLVGLSLLSSATPAVKAVAKTGLSFGGRVVLMIPCLSLLGPSVWTLIVPAPGTKQPAYIWTPATLRGIPPPGAPPLYPPITTPDPPPYIIGQQILGVADAPYFCCPPPSYPTPAGCFTGFLAWTPLPGQRMQWANQSLLPSTGAEAAALMAGIAPL